MKREIVLLVLLLLPSVMAESTEDNMILPTHYLWKFDLMWERVVLFLTPAEAKPELYLMYAQERTSELQELGTEVTIDIFNKVEAEWQQSISKVVDSAERENHALVLNAIRGKVSKDVSEHIEKYLLPVVDLVND